MFFSRCSYVMCSLSAASTQVYEMKKDQCADVWLLSFMASSPDVTIESLRVIGGLSLDECYTTTGVRHKFLLLRLSGGVGISLSAVDRFLERIKSGLGIEPHAMPGSIRAVSNAGGDKHIWAHPAFRLMVGRMRQKDGGHLGVWLRPGLSFECGLLCVNAGSAEPACGCVTAVALPDLVQRKRECLYESLAAAREVMMSGCVKREGGDTAATASAGNSDPGVDAVMDSADDKRTVSGGNDRGGAEHHVQRKRQRVDADGDGRVRRYEYERRANDDRWTLGWV